MSNLHYQLTLIFILHIRYCSVMIEYTSNFRVVFGITST